MIFKIWNKITETMHENISEIGFDKDNQPCYAIIIDEEKKITLYRKQFDLILEESA